MRKIRIVFAALVIFLPWFLTGRGYCGGDLEVREIFAEVYDLHREISLLNLVNGLYLSPEQMNQMLPILRKVEATREEYQSRAVSQAHQTEEILKGIREIVARDEKIDGDLVREFRRAKKKGEDLKEEFHGAMMAYQDEMKTVLNENQIALIDEFRPCIIPPRDTWDSVRVGQAFGDTRMGERFLTRVREMDENVYQRRKPLLIERHVGKVERHVGLFSDDERAEEESRLADIFKRVRELSDLDFEAQKGDLARELKEPQEKALQSPHRKRKGDLDKLGRFLLDPKLIPILEKRLAQVSAR